ncbi:MAG: CHAD domain-containing protein [Drouetiella hepatica Uher 2000/2452]|jgi:CHAD domain-containing protein|uniref:CHAD domain-containing protein n=1 Tax=Drouetiella hepatica Uher 2000/2452 TaxID=904376 RepID=A0A951QEP4_9CYAN|nr:CHAD domain-containing protein [Drouetiella hepatica Uher 2000/2452]
MKKGQKSEAATPENGQKKLTLGDYAHQVIGEHYSAVIQEEESVLADHQPEHLHHMRVGTRRLRTALQVFRSVANLPKAARETRLRDLARVLGEVRDLDVQIAILKQDYLPQISPSEQALLEKAIADLQKRRPKVFKKMKSALRSDRYSALRQGYTDWMAQPSYGAIAELSILSLLPDLLTPLLSELLLHPGWLISAQLVLNQQTDSENALVLHDLRKLCKHVRYEAEFFTSFYGKDFQKWIKEIKGLQENLGTFQDTQVLLDLLSQGLAPLEQLPELQAVIQKKQALALSNWDALRQKYLKSDYRYHLHQMLLQPTSIAPLLKSAIDPSIAQN